MVRYSMELGAHMTRQAQARPSGVPHDLQASRLSPADWKRRQVDHDCTALTV